VLSHRKMDVTVFAATSKKIAFVASDEYDEARWVSPEALRNLPASTLCKKILKAAGRPTSTSSKPLRPRKESR
jgi:hypothetical protein